MNERTMNARYARPGAATGRKKSLRGMTVVSEDGYADAVVPEMPDPLYWISQDPDNPIDWPAPCVGLWRAIWTSPMRGSLVEADEGAAALAIFHQFQVLNTDLRPGDRNASAKSLEGSLRQLGMTPLARNQLKVQVAQGESAEARRKPAPPTKKETSEEQAKVIDLYNRHA